MRGICMSILSTLVILVQSKLKNLFLHLILAVTVVFVGEGFALAQTQTTSLQTPNVSVNTLFLYRNSNYNKADESETRNGIDMQETEIALYSDVDPYSRLYVLLALRPEYTYDATTKTVTQDWVLEPEELYAESTVLPATVLRLGKFRAMFGKHNMLHAHTFPFVDAPVTNTTLLGDEGLNDVGASAAVLLPSSWYNELTFQYLRGEGENAAFNSKTPGDGVGLVHWKNLFDLSDELTLEVGGSYAEGNNSLAIQNSAAKTRIDGVDLTLKWRPVESAKSRSWIVGSEYIHRTVEQPTSQDENSQGYTVWGQYQWAPRWFARFRFEEFQSHGSNAAVNTNPIANNDVRATTAGLEFKATEFSYYRVEYGLHKGPFSPTEPSKDEEHRFYLQANFTIGAHPAHAY